ncbi:HisA/HisF-related TIM barrel protein [Flavobacteriaceae bacterium]|nr:HisA/HisF-related TIM barrel protein [Flavobacteriaceae bacterium]
MMRIGSMVLFKNGYCYQSYGWNLLRPLGKLQNIVYHLDKYLIDDITIIRPIREYDDNSSLLSDLNEIKQLKSSTPISFGGGIRNINQLNLIRELPVERFVFSSALFNKESSLLKAATDLFGKQAIVGLIPFKFNPQLSVFNSQLNRFTSINNVNNIELCDEIILYDCEGEGSANGFNEEIVNKLNIGSENFVFSGGVSDLVNYYKNHEKTPKAIAIENSVLYREFSKSNYYEKL